MADLILDMDWDISKAEAKKRKLDREFELSRQKAENIKKELEKNADSIEQSKQKQKQLNEELDRSAQKLDAYYKGQSELTDKQIKSEMKHNSEIQKSLEKEEQYQSALEKNHIRQEAILNKQKAKTASIGDQILLNSKKQNKFAQAMERSSKSADRFGRRIKSLIVSALFFSIVTKAFTALRNEFGKLITETGTKTASLAAQLNGSLSVLGRTLYESAKPYIEWILEKLIKMVNVLTYGLAKILGKNVNEMKKLARETKKTAEETKKVTAGFDTVQTLNSSNSSSSSSSGTGIGTNFDAISGGIESETAHLMMILSGASLVLGVILAFSGVNIPLGLGLIALGAVGLASSLAANWGTMEQKTKDSITGIMAIGGSLFILLGLALLLTGAGIPLGIGLILLGAGMLYGACRLSPGDTFVEKVRNLWNNCKKIINDFISWFSEKVLDGIFGEGFGDSLDDMFDSWTYLWEDIISFFKNIFLGNWKEAGKDFVNIWVDWFNLLISKFNIMLQGLLGGGSKLINAIGKIFGKEWNLNADWAKIPKIPRLATGAVLPGGSPMLAWVNDQPKGQPYVEGSIENIAAAFEKYLGDKGFGNQNVTLEVNGNLAQFFRYLNVQIKKEDKRASIWG